MYDVTATGELLIDFTRNGLSEQNNRIYEANPGGAPCNVLAMLGKLGYKTAFIGKVGDDEFGKLLKNTIKNRRLILQDLFLILMLKQHLLL
nr:PfkB family carbohydrate kinase [Catenibacterium sp.]